MINAHPGVCGAISAFRSTASANLCSARAASAFGGRQYTGSQRSCPWSHTLIGLADAARDVNSNAFGVVRQQTSSLSSARMFGQLTRVPILSALRRQAMTRKSGGNSFQQRRDHSLVLMSSPAVLSPRTRAVATATTHAACSRFKPSAISKRMST